MQKVCFIKYPKAGKEPTHKGTEEELELNSASTTLAALTDDRWRRQLELGYWFMLQSLDLGKGRFLVSFPT